MSKTQIIKCDICGKEGALTCYLKVDRRADPAGRSEDVDEPIDLCPAHQWATYKLAEQLLNFKQVQQVFANLKARRRRVIQITDIGGGI